MTRLVETSRTVITMAFFVMNAEKIVRLLRLLFAFLITVYIAMMCLRLSLASSSAFEGDLICL